MNPASWARANGVHPQTTHRWFRPGAMPVPAHRLPSGHDPAQGAGRWQPVGSSRRLCAWVTAHDQRADLDRQVARLTADATDATGGEGR